jgi:hypothetical protein
VRQGSELGIDTLVHDPVPDARVHPYQINTGSYPSIPGNGAPYGNASFAPGYPPQGNAYQNGPFVNPSNGPMGYTSGYSRTFTCLFTTCLCVLCIGSHFYTFSYFLPVRNNGVDLVHFMASAPQGYPYTQGPPVPGVGSGASISSRDSSVFFARSKFDPAEVAAEKMEKQQSPVGYTSAYAGAPLAYPSYPPLPTSNNPPSSTVYAVIPESQFGSVDPLYAPQQIYTAPVSSQSTGQSMASTPNHMNSAPPVSYPYSAPVSPPSSQVGRQNFTASKKKKSLDASCCCAPCCCLGRSLCRMMCCGCCCLIVILAIVAAALYFTVRKPNVTFKNAVAPTNRNTLVLSSASSVKVNWDFLFEVENRNWFNVNLYTIDMKAFPVESQSPQNMIANGTLTGVSIGSNAKTNVRFPVTFGFDITEATQTQFFVNLLNACGVNAGQATNPGKQISIVYQISLGLDIIKWTGVRIPVEDTISFDCPVSLANHADIASVIQVLKSPR